MATPPRPNITGSEQRVLDHTDDGLHAGLRHLLDDCAGHPPAESCGHLVVGRGQPPGRIRARAARRPRRSCGRGPARSPSAPRGSPARRRPAGPPRRSALARCAGTARRRRRAARPPGRPAANSVLRPFGDPVDDRVDAVDVESLAPGRPGGRRRHSPYVAARARARAAGSGDGKAGMSAPCPMPGIRVAARVPPGSSRRPAWSRRSRHVAEPRPRRPAVRRRCGCRSR